MLPRSASRWWPRVSADRPLNCRRGRCRISAGRPRSTTRLPLFNFDDYFLGKWTFEWDTPEGALGPSGHIEGTTIYKAIDAGKFYEAVTEATGPGGAFKLRETIAYQKENKTLARYVTDSRGFSFLQAGTIGGDLGGLYTIYFDGSPFVYNGKTVRMKHAMRMLSPLNYKVATTVSVNGGPVHELRQSVVEEGSVGGQGLGIGSGIRD